MQSKNPFDQFDGTTNKSSIYTSPKVTAETSSSESHAAKDRAETPYVNANAKAESQIKIAQAEKAMRENDQQRAESMIGTMTANSQLHGDAYLNANVPASMREAVKAYARGDVGSRSGGLSTSMLPIIQHAMNYDPTASGTNFPARVKMQSDLAGSQPNTAGGALRAAERMLLHAREVLRSGQSLGNFAPGLLGTIGNNLKTSYNHVTNDPTTHGYDSFVANYAPEAQKAIAQTAGGIEERQSRAAALSAALPQEARAASLQSDAKQARDAMSAVNDQYKRLMGRDVFNALSPDGKSAYDEIMAGGYDEKGRARYPASGYTPISGSAPGATPPGSTPPGSGGPQGGGGPAMPPVGFGQNFAPTGGASGSNELATGQSAQRRDPQTNALIDSMIRSGASPAAINAKLASIGKGGADPKAITDSQEYLRNNPNYKGSFADATTLSPTTASNQFSASPAGAFFTAASDAINPFASDFSNNRDEFRQLHGLLRGQHPYASVAGDLVGGTAAAMALEGGAGALASRFFAPVAGETAAALQAAKATRGIQIARTGDAAYGAASGVGNADDGNRLIGGAVGAVSGLGGGMLGRTATRGVSAVTRGVTDASVNYLRNAGVPLTFGQAAGGTAKWLEDRASSFIPSINARRGEGVKGVVDAAFNQGVSSIPGQINAPTGPQMVEQGKALVKNAFNGALDGRSIPVDTGAGSPWAAEIAKGAGTPTYGSDFSALIADHADPLLANGSLSGQDFQRLDRTLSGNARAYSNIGQGTPTTPPAPMATRVGQSFNNLGDILDNSVHAAAPDIIPQYDAAKSAFRHIGILRDAVDQARNGSASGVPGLPTPAQINTAASRNAKQFGGTQGTTEVPFYKLTEAAQNVLPSRVPDSGTAGRLMVAGGLGALGGGGMGYTGGDTAGGAGAGLGYTAAGLGVGSLLYSKTAQKLAVEALLRRSGMMGRIAGKVDNVSPYAGMLGTAGGAAATPYLLGSN